MLFAPSCRSRQDRYQWAWWVWWREGSLYQPADSQKVPKLSQTHPEQLNTSPTTANFTHPRLVHSGFRQLVRLPPPPDCSSVLRHAGILPTYTHAHGQKGQCALNAGASSLTSEPFSKCHLAPEQQHQQWLLFQQGASEARSYCQSHAQRAW